jgi:GH25 family lysozyme M1 (1,4-beta-N-acetylmuramidase)
MNAKLFDASHYQTLQPNMATAKGAGYVCAIWKATEGSSYTDPSYAAARSAAAAIGFPFIPYHLGRNTTSGASQFDFFERVADPPEGSIVMLDIEAGWAIDPAHARDWLGRARDKGYRCLIYGMPEEVITLASLGDLFEVAWSSSPLRSPWTIKQLTARPVPGIGGNTDYDEFNGDADAFQAWYEGGDMATPDDVAAALGIGVNNLKNLGQVGLGMVRRVNDKKPPFDRPSPGLERAGYDAMDAALKKSPGG